MIEVNNDLRPSSYIYSMTPHYIQRQLPFYAYSGGYYDTGAQYYCKQDGIKGYLLFVTVGGKGRLQWKGQTVILERGTAALIRCDSFQEYAPYGAEGWRYHYLHLDIRQPEGYAGILMEQSTAVSLRDPGRVVDDMMRLCELSIQLGQASYAEQSHLISELLTEMICSVEEPMQQASYRNDIASLAEYIRENCEKDLHIEDFVKRANLSRYYLIHLFEKQVGTSPYRYLHLCRINRAQTLLLTTDRQVSEIADLVGYPDSTAFIRHFRSFHGITPREYRKTVPGR